MDVANELLDAIEIIVDKKIRENTAQIYFGVCKSVNGDSCVMSINGKNNTIHFYGSAPIVGLTYRVFVPNGNMSMAFAITGNDDRKGLYYSNPNLLDNWYFGNPINQRGQTSYTGPGYTIDRWALSASTSGSFLLHSSDNYSADVKGTFYQRIENKRLIVGAKYTLSVLRGLIASPTLYYETFTLTENVGWKSRFNVNGGTFGFYYAQNNSDIQFDLDDLKTIIAAKLELGSQQTLAHQDENGNWVLNELPNYADTLARCQLYRRQFNAYTKFIAQYIDGNKVVFVLPVSMRTAPSMSGAWRIYTGFTEQTGFTLNTYQTGNIIVVEAVKENHGLSSAWLGVDNSDVGILNAEL